MVLERKRRQLNEIVPNENTHDVSQSDTSINEKHTENTFDNVTLVVQGPSDDNDENESQKVWTMEMLMNDSDISTSMMNEPEQVSEEDKKFLYARAVHSNHSIQYHMQQIIEQQKVVDEYRSTTMEGMGLTPLESSLHKYDPVVISQIMQMIEADNFWHQKTFEAVLTNLWRRWDGRIHKQKDVSTHCMENSEISNEMDGVEVIDLCSVSQTRNGELCEEKKAQSKKVRTK